MTIQTYTVTGVVNSTAQAEILGYLDDIMAYMGGSAADGGFPDGDKIDPGLDTQMNEEIAALKVAIDAASEA